MGRGNRQLMRRSLSMSVMGVNAQSKGQGFFLVDLKYFQFMQIANYEEKKTSLSVNKSQCTGVTLTTQ